MPEKVAIPPETVCVSVPCKVPVPVVRDRVTVVELLPLRKSPLAFLSSAVNVVIGEELEAV